MGARQGVEFIADRGDHGHRLDRAVLRHGVLHGLSRARLQRLIAAGEVAVNGSAATRPAQRLRAGDVVRLLVTAPPPRRAAAAEPLPLDVVYEDDDLIVVNKPSGQVAHPSYRNRSGTLLNALLGRAAAAEARWQPHLLHRLDKDTSGLLAVAKSRRVLAALQRGAIAKDYLALVWGRPSPATGRIDMKLGRDPLDRRRVMASHTGAAATTDYRTLARGRGPARGLTLLACRLVTGRTHQLRVHLAANGWPLVGDRVYRARTGVRLPDARLHRDATTFPRQALHAWRLSFAHPRSRLPLTLVAEPPADLQRWLALLRVQLPD
jgi:23S rRNA pseudouridine1911/1915/1917 synthase